MNERLRTIMEVYGISPVRLAELLGVQPSNISHIISGRNKPGYDFISKLLQSFPLVNPRWLILGEGPMNLEDGSSSSEKNETPHNTLFKIDSLDSEEKRTRDELDNKQSEEESSEKKEFNLHGDKIFDEQNPLNKSENIPKIDRIVVFFSNGLFTEYKPDNS